MFFIIEKNIIFLLNYDRSYFIIPISRVVSVEQIALRGVAKSTGTRQLL